MLHDAIALQGLADMQKTPDVISPNMTSGKCLQLSISSRSCHSIVLQTLLGEAVQSCCSIALAAA